MRRIQLAVILVLGASNSGIAQVGVAGSYGLIDMTPRHASGGASLLLNESGDYSLVSRFDGTFNHEEGKFLVLGDSIFFRPTDSRSRSWGGRRVGNELLLRMFESNVELKFSKGVQSANVVAAPASAADVPWNPVYDAAMRSDLRNLASKQEAYLRTGRGYSGSIADLGFQSSTGVSAPIIKAGARSWSATVSHAQMRGYLCGIAVGTANPVDTFANEREPACRAPR